MMRIQLFIAGLILWLHISICNVWSQNNIPRPPVTLPSPNVASLGQYGNYPVSYFTGVPQITIPIYELQEKNLHVPISLSYHASGFRPDQHPGWVGLGWSLQAGGVITRQVNDLKDEYDNPNFYQGEKAGYYYNSSVLNRSDWNQTSYLQMVTRSNDNLCLKDTEPDEFSFSLPSGTSGKFYRTHTGKWKVSCDRPISVEVTTTSLLEQPFTPPYESLFEKYGYKYTKTFAGFSITDENGIKYIFGSNGSTTNAIEYSIGFFKQNIDEWTATSWYLTTIQHPNGEKIDFTYERDSFIAQMYISVYKDIITRVVGHSGLFNPRPSCQSSSGTIPIGMYYSGELISPVYLSEVSTTNVKVKFIRTNTTELRYAQSVFDWQYYLEYFINLAYPSFLPFLEDNGWSTYPTCLSKLQWKKLDQVRIEENKVLQKAFNFDYSKNINQRLTLLSLTEQGGSDNLLKPAYVFSYDTSVPLPDYLKNTSDHWGFYNGTYAYIDSVNAYYNYREAKAGYLLAGTLNKIKYPTGGITDFLFEPNQYSQQAADNRENAPVMYEQDKIAGGLRIRKISSYDSLRPQEKVEKEYYYVKDYTGGSFANFRSSGILGGQIKYYFDDYRATAFNDDKVTYSKSIFSSQSVLPGNYNSQGSHIGYSEIIEKLSDGSYTKYTYSNLDNAAYRDLAADNSLQPNRIIYQPYANREMNRGKLLSEQNYNSINKLLRSRIINYQQIGTDTEVRALRALYFNVCPNTAVSVEEATAYKFLTHSFLPINEQITVYQ